MQDKNIHLFEDSARIISRVCSKIKPVQAAYVFGSLAKNSKRNSTDIDVAILLDDESAGSFPLLSLDVVVLNRAGEVLKFEIRRSGKLVFERSPRARKKFEIQGRKTYEDFLYPHERYVKNVLYGARNG